MADSDLDLNTHTFGTKVSPGVVRWSNHGRPKNWDVKDAKGSTGASTTLNGDKPRKFTGTYSLTDDEDFAAWDSFQPYVESTTNGPTPFALPIFHPDLARVGITEATNAGIGPLVRDGKGGATVTIDYLEYRPAKKKKAASATAKTTGATANAKPDPNAAAKAELAALIAEAKKP